MQTMTRDFDTFTVEEVDLTDDQAHFSLKQFTPKDGDPGHISVEVYERADDPRTIRTGLIDDGYYVSVGHATLWMTRSEALTLFGSLDETLATS